MINGALKTTRHGDEITRDDLGAGGRSAVVNSPAEGNTSADKIHTQRCDKERGTGAAGIARSSICFTSVASHLERFKMRGARGRGEERKITSAMRLAHAHTHIRTRGGA